MAPLQIYLLGAPRILRNGKAVEMDTRKAIALLAYLGIEGIPLTRDAIATVLYPELDQSRARAALRRTLSTLKNALKSPALEISRENLYLDTDRELWIDVKEFSRLIDQSNDHGHEDEILCEECIDWLESAAQLYQGDFLAGFTLRDSPSFDDWEFYKAESLRNKFSLVLSQLTSIMCAKGEFESGIEYARRWLALDLLNEEAHRALIECLAWSGQQNAALRQYRECVRILDQELGVPPLEETTRLYHSIMERKITRPEFLVNPTPRTGGLEAETPPTRRREGLPLVGRVRDLENINWSFQWSATKGCLFLLEGEAGIGKTRLAEEFLNKLEDRGASILASRCYDGETGMAYSPFAGGLRKLIQKPGMLDRLKGIEPHWLIQVSRLMPEINQILPLPGDFGQNAGLISQSNFFEGLRLVILRLLTPNPPGVIFLDDLQWADDASLDFLAFLARRLDQSPLFILGTWRDENTEAVQRLQQIIADSRREGIGKTLKLNRLTQEDIDQLIGSLAREKGKLPENFNTRLFQESEGLPFIAVEYLNLLNSGKSPEGLSWSEQDEWPLPGNVSDVMQARLARVGKLGWQLLSTAAAIGRSFDFALLMNASGRTESETLSGLEELLAQNVIVERKKIDSPGLVLYDFSHEKIRFFVYEQTSLTRRRLVHRRIAEVLLDQGRAQRDSQANPGTIASHFLMAGQLSQAAEFFFLAGEKSRRVSAHRQAVTNYRLALSNDHPEKAVIHEAIGDSQVMLGEYDDALASFETAIALCTVEVAARLEMKLGNVHHRQGDHKLAICHFQIASEDRHHRSDPIFQSQLHAVWSRSTFLNGEAEQAEELAWRALELAESGADRQARAQAHNIIGIIKRHEGDLVKAKEHLELSLELAEGTGDPSSLVAAMNNLALLNESQGDTNRAIELTQSALVHCERIGDLHLEAALHSNLADLYHRIGETDRAMEQLQSAAAIFGEIGMQAGEFVPEIWKLTEW